MLALPLEGDWSCHAGHPAQAVTRPCSPLFQRTRVLAKDWSTLSDCLVFQTPSACAILEPVTWQTLGHLCSVVILHFIFTMCKSWTFEQRDAWTDFVFTFLEHLWHEYKYVNKADKFKNIGDIQMMFVTYKWCVTRICRHSKICIVCVGKDRNIVRQICAYYIIERCYRASKTGQQRKSLD